jgi:hypothetical protein
MSLPLVTAAITITSITYQPKAAVECQASTSYSGGPVFESHPEPATLPEAFPFPAQSLQTNAGIMS